MTQTHSKKFHCTYLLHYYPFDTQICIVDLQVEEFVKNNVELLPDKMDLLTFLSKSNYVNYSDKNRNPILFKEEHNRDFITKFI